jgi:hypothetical protein
MLHCEIVNEWSTTDSGIRKELERKGYRYLGQGVDQMAFTDPHNPNAILKIFGTQDTTKGGGISSDHRMLYVWAKFCQQNSSNPYLPKFYGVETFRWKDRTYLQISQEKLQPNRRFNEHLCQSLVSAVEMGYDFDEWLRSNKMMGRSFSGGGTKRSVRDMSDDPKQKAQLRGFFNTVEKLHEIANDYGYSFDLHEGNIMMRADTTPVISDPWVDYEGSEAAATTEPKF